ncbi:MAG TPA: DoxX family protein [Blastocatellia bacterium]|nr:DoxX family protein [Blastocatellia bacterium]HMX29566.1 DoxX family protein [Blastocatellia bacterium]HMY76030.1 DoxX family protein [Blastocatellia bacterium]HMZ16781.1 DoxX family protein [Blastocatellia bacterium]HNG30409.1 DoxX family protein [Blastocatellia bacterium]
MAGRLTTTINTWALFPLRLALGAIFFAHGAQKIFGVWGGRGLTAWAEATAPFPFLQPAWAWMSAAAFAEFFGGLMVMLGFLTRIGALMIAGVMGVALVGVHWKNGFFLTSGGYEYTLALLAMALTLVIAGGGNGSVDYAKFGGK